MRINRSDILRISLIAAIVAFVLATRFVALGMRPFHHDESLFAHRAYHLFKTGDYVYDPILHGPFLIDITALIFRLSGDSDVTARLWAAISGVLLIILVWLLRGRIGRRAAFAAVLMLALSPTLLFYSRFNRNDVPFTLAAMTFVCCIMRLAQTRRALYLYFALLAVAWMICIKETYVIFLFTVATFGMGVFVVGQIGNLSLRGGQSGRSGLGGLIGRIAKLSYVVATILGLLVGWFLIRLLYSTFFLHPEHGPIEAIRYWAGQHAEQRIFGEFYYYISILIIYEFLPLAIFIWGIGRLLRETPWLRGRVGWAWAIVSVVLFFILWPIRFSPEFAKLIHMTSGWHLWLAMEVFALGATACAALVLDGRRIEAFFVWWTMGSFLAYSYAGEKVPWIAVHIAFPMIVSAAMFFQKEWDRLPVCRSSCRILAPAVLCTAFAATVFVSLRLNFVNYANVAERHVYTHTTKDYVEMVREVDEIVRRAVQVPPSKFPLIVEGDSLWPAQWYFRHYQLALTAPTSRLVPIFICDEFVDREHRDFHAFKRWPWLPETHVVRRVPFREWWHQEPLMAEFARLFDIWMALVPKQYRRIMVTDTRGNAIVFFGDPARIPNMTVEEKVRASKHAWRSYFNYIIFRRDFDPYRATFKTRDHMAVLLCVRKDIYEKWISIK